jgi:CheY-like chemotaxis protein
LTKSLLIVLKFWREEIEAVQERKRNVLLVDDDPVFKMLNTILLKKTGKVGSIQSAENGLQALSVLKACFKNNEPLPDIIFLDLNMPVMDGFQFLEHLHVDPALDLKGLQIIVLSSSFDPRDKTRAKKLGVASFIEKPLNLAQANEILGMSP